MNTTRSNYRVHLLFFASGISGLMYQVVWLRMLSRLLGVTIYATSTVMAAFMGGLALGSFFNWPFDNSWRCACGLTWSLKRLLVMAR